MNTMYANSTVRDFMCSLELILVSTCSILHEKKVCATCAVLLNMKELSLYPKSACSGSPLKKYKCFLYKDMSLNLITKDTPHLVSQIGMYSPSGRLHASLFVWIFYQLHIYCL